jgi:hypothetical protein
MAAFRAHPSDITEPIISAIIFIAVLTSGTAVTTWDSTASRVAQRVTAVKLINPTSLGSKVVTHVTHALVLKLGFTAPYIHLVTHSLKARGDVALHVVKLHFIVAKVITAKLNITIMTEIPTVILIDQKTVKK